MKMKIEIEGEWEEIKEKFAGLFGAETIVKAERKQHEAQPIMIRSIKDSKMSRWSKFNWKEVLGGKTAGDYVYEQLQLKKDPQIIRDAMILRAKDKFPFLDTVQIKKRATSIIGNITTGRYKPKSTVDENGAELGEVGSV